jgi:hypothetical protein
MSVPPVGSVAAALRTTILSAAEAELAQALGDAGDAAQTSPTPTQADAAASAVSLARAAAAGRQGGLAPLFADLQQAAASPGLPAQMRAAIAQVLALRTPLDGAFTAETAMRAVSQSGLFLEAHVAQGGEPPPDLKAALLRLGASLAAAQGADAPPHPADQVPPPTRGAALAAQAVAPATLPADAEAPVVVQRLQGEVEQAVARQTLHQLASLPDGQGAAWMFELPLATPQGTAVAQFEVQRDGRSPDGGEPVPGWRLRFCVDVEPLGPVHVQLGLAGEQAAVTVWAERPEALEALRREAPALARELSAGVMLHAGAPHPPAQPPPGRFLDRTS